MNEPLKHLDYGQAVVFLEKAIAEKGADYEYEAPSIDYETNTAQCVYFHGGQPSCVVGHVLSYMGYESAREGVCASLALGDLGIEADMETMGFLDVVQDYQDTGYSWGEALRMAQWDNS